MKLCVSTQNDILFNDSLTCYWFCRQLSSSLQTVESLFLQFDESCVCLRTRERTELVWTNSERLSRDCIEERREKTYLIISQETHFPCIQIQLQFALPNDLHPTVLPFHAVYFFVQLSHTHFLFESLWQRDWVSVSLVFILVFVLVLELPFLHEDRFSFTFPFVSLKSLSRKLLLSLMMIVISSFTNDCLLWRSFNTFLGNQRWFCHALSSRLIFILHSFIFVCHSLPFLSTKKRHRQEKTCSQGKENAVRTKHGRDKFKKETFRLFEKKRWILHSLLTQVESHTLREFRTYYFCFPDETHTQLLPFFFAPFFLYFFLFRVYFYTTFCWKKQ